MPERLRATLAAKNQTREFLSRRSLLWTEQYVSPNGIVGIVGRWGERRPRAAMDRQIEREAQEQGVESKPFADFGSVELYRMPSGYEEAEIDADAKEVAIRLATRILARKGWDPEVVDYFDFGSSVGKGDTAAELASDLGLVNAKTLTARLACNSAGYLLARRLQDPDAFGKKVLLLDVDPITRILIDPKRSDPVSRLMFSNGAAGITYEPLVDMEYLNGFAIERRDPRGITAIAPNEQEVGDWEGDETHVIHTDEKGNVRVKFHRSPEGTDFWMNGRATALFFVRLGGDGEARVVQKHEANYPGRGFDHETGHQASEPIGKLVKQYLKEKYGIEIKSEWGVVRDGNSSSATSLIAFVRSMQNYQPEDHVLYASYGAGGTGNFFAIRVGASTPQRA